MPDSFLATSYSRCPRRRPCPALQSLRRSRTSSAEINHSLEKHCSPDNTQPDSTLPRAALFLHQSNEWSAQKSTAVPTVQNCRKHRHMIAIADTTLSPTRSLSNSH